MIGGLSGLCTGSFLLMLALFLVQAQAPTDLLLALSLPFVMGGLPLGAGGAAILAGRRLLRAQPNPRFGWPGTVLGLLIMASSVYFAAEAVLKHSRFMGPYRIPEVLIAAAFAAGGALLAMSVSELTRRRAP